MVFADKAIMVLYGISGIKAKRRVNAVIWERGRSRAEEAGLWPVYQLWVWGEGLLAGLVMGIFEIVAI